MSTADQAREKMEAELLKQIESLPRDNKIDAFRFTAKITLPPGRGAIGIIANRFGVARMFVHYCLEVRAAFLADPALKEEWEPRILSGACAPYTAVQYIRGNKNREQARAKTLGAPAPGTGAHFLQQFTLGIAPAAALKHITEFGKQMASAIHGGTGAEALARLRATPEGRAKLEAAKPAALPARKLRTLKKKK